MKALITGASSGIGRDIAKNLYRKGAELWLVARRHDRLEALRSELGERAHIIVLDLSFEENCRKLYSLLKNENIDILINNAGFGQFGRFNETSLERELVMIDLNIKALHILTKLFLNDFIARNSGYILNVASSAAFLPGPLMSVYYSTKTYVYRLTAAISEELRRSKSRVYIGTLCPGPVDTEFNECAGVSFALKSLNSKTVADYAVKKMFQRKTVIVPGFKIRLGVFFQRFLPLRARLRISYNIQSSKEISDRSQPDFF